MQINTLSFDLLCHAGDIPGFRACIAELAGMKEVFHNHNNQSGMDSGLQHWGYPLVQYTVRGSKPVVIGIGAGARAVRQLLLVDLPPTLTFAGRTRPINGFRLQQIQFTPKLLANAQCYGLHGWLALNAGNYRSWKATDDPTERKFILSRALTGQLRSFAQAVGIANLEQVKGEVLQVDNQKRIYWRKIPFVRFHALINSNLSLPTGIGLGRNVAFGYGEILPVSVYKRLLVKQPISQVYHR